MKVFHFILMYLAVVFVAVIVFVAVGTTPDVPLSPVPPKTHTIVFIPGLHLAAKDYHSTLTALQRQGYTVQVYQPTEQDPTNYPQIVTAWTQGVTHFIGNQRVIVIGHSIGGAAAVHYCATNSHCVAGVNLDGSPAFNDTLHVPFLYVQGNVGRYCTAGCISGRALMTTITKQSHTQMVYLPQIKHMNFTDDESVLLYAQDYETVFDGHPLIQQALLDFLRNK